MAHDTQTRTKTCETVAPSCTLRTSALVGAAALVVGALSVVAVNGTASPGEAGSHFVTVIWGAVAVAAAGTVEWAARAFRRPPVDDGRLGLYTLNEKIGEGGMGVVYKAQHALLPRPAAIKLLPRDRAGEERVKRFEREVQVTSSLTHPNTISIYDFGRTPDGTFYYAMEYVDGFDLETLVERDGPQDPARVAHLLAQLAGALAEAHAVGLIHRDVKPANVMVCERGGIPDVVKVLDFGLVKEVAPAGPIKHTDEQRVVGTPLYLSPEALTAPEALDARADLYALGAVGYFLLTGAPPFSGKNLLEICAHHLHTAPVPPSEKLGRPLPETLERLILSCLAKSPEARPASAAAVQKALLRFAAEWTDERATAWWADHARESGVRERAAFQATTPGSEGTLLRPALAA